MSDALDSDDLALTLKVVSCLQAHAAARTAWDQLEAFWTLLCDSFIETPGAANPATAVSGGWGLVTVHAGLVGGREVSPHVIPTALLVRAVSGMLPGDATLGQQLRGRLASAEAWLIELACASDHKLSPGAASLTAWALEARERTPDVVRALNEIHKTLRREVRLRKHEPKWDTHPVFYTVHFTDGPAENRYAIYSTDVILALALVGDRKSARKSFDYLNKVSDGIVMSVRSHGAFRSSATGGLGTTDNHWAFLFLTAYRDFLTVRNSRFLPRLWMNWWPIIWRAAAALAALAASLAGAVVAARAENPTWVSLGTYLSALLMVAIPWLVGGAVKTWRARR